MIQFLVTISQRDLNKLKKEFEEGEDMTNAEVINCLFLIEGIDIRDKVGVSEIPKAEKYY